MPNKNRKVRPGYKIGTVITENGEVLTPPSDWSFLPAGDAPLTRSVKKRGVCWQVLVQKGRRTISKGIWVNTEYVNEAKAELEAKRATPEYARRRQADRERRERKHLQYVDEFYNETVKYLNFHPNHKELATRLAQAVTKHATPVGSGTVARTERIPLEKRVQAAVIAWMRHQTTAYEKMSIARIKGKRREVRRMLAERSKELLDYYRNNDSINKDCPLCEALDYTPDTKRLFPSVCQ